MPRITLNELKSKIEEALEQGMSNKEMAEHFNREFVEDGNRLSASDIPKYKDMVGLKGAKPKKKKEPFFEIVDESSEEEDQSQIPESEYHREFPTSEY